MARRSGTVVFQIVVYTTLTVFLAVSVVPLLMMWLIALRPATQSVLEPFAIPDRLTLQNLEDAWVIGKMGQYTINSVIVIVPRVLGVLLLSCLAGYGFGKLRFPGRDTIFHFVLFGMMVPIQAIMIPIFYNVQKMGMINTFWALIVPALGMSMPFAVFFMRAFFRDLPNELMDSARIDGAGELQTFLRIMLPLTVPALASMLVFQFMWGWNDFLLPLLMIYTDKLRTLPVGLMYFRTRYTTNYSLVAAGVTLSSVPIVLIYALFQRSFVRGLTAGAVKG
jgi:ABC-type glycerol-3-phosphate transport system permease component